MDSQERLILSCYISLPSNNHHSHHHNRNHRPLSWPKQRQQLPGWLKGISVWKSDLAPYYFTTGMGVYWAEQFYSNSGTHPYAVFAAAGLTNRVKTYINGTADLLYNPTTWTENDKPLYIGCGNANGTPSNAFTGAIDAVWIGTATEAAIITLMGRMAGLQINGKRTSDPIPTWTKTYYVSLGDSKAGGSFQTAFNNNANSVTKGYTAYSRGYSGETTAQISAHTDADIAATTNTPDLLMLNTGANDFLSMPTESDLKTNIAYILDQYHAAFPSMQIGVMHTWRRNYMAQANIWNGWVDDVIADRAWCTSGPDERIFLENGDDGYTYTADGVHPNTAGYNLTAQLWMDAFGL